MTSAPLRRRNAEQITATVLFADLVGFDRFSAASGTETAYLAVTHLLRLLDGIARKHGGSVDKYLGDKLMAVFGHPVPLKWPERAAARAALEMRERVREFEDRGWSSEFAQVLRNFEIIVAVFRAPFV